MYLMRESFWFLLQKYNTPMREVNNVCVLHTFYFLPLLRVCARYVYLPTKAFLGFMFQNVFATHWFSIGSVCETLNMKFHFKFHPFILYLLHQVFKSLAPSFQISCTKFLNLLHQGLEMKHKWNFEGSMFHFLTRWKSIVYEKNETMKPIFPFFTRNRVDKQQFVEELRNTPLGVK